MDCNHQWREHSRRSINYERYYKDWLYARRTLSDIARILKIPVPTLRKRFDTLPAVCALKPSPDYAVNLVIDATFFGRDYGYLCFSDTQRVIYFREIKTENVQALRSCLDDLKRAGYRFKSITIDGKRGFLHALQAMFPHTPIQMCHFHQKAIIRRYITTNPKSQCGQDLKALMHRFGKEDSQIWIDAFFALYDKHKVFLKERNEQEEFIHRRLRSAFRSLKTNLPYLFLCNEIPLANIPNTTNHLEGAFAYLKEKIKIHRGLKKQRKKKAIEFILSKT